MIGFHYKNLEHKLKRQQENLHSTEKLIRLLENNVLEMSFTTNMVNERRFLALDAPQSEDDLNPKAYYDLHADLVEKNVYTERSFLLVYQFEDLQNPSQLDGLQCLEIDGSSTVSPENVVVFPKGMYLSLLYLYRDEEKDNLVEIYRGIEEYLKENGLKRISSQVIEMEHPELSIIFGEDVNIYELQIQVRKENTRE